MSRAQVREARVGGSDREAPGARVLLHQRGAAAREPAAQLGWVLRELGA